MNPLSVSIEINKYDNMKVLKLIPVIFISLGIFSPANTVYADSDCLLYTSDAADE